jgi:hypothetical protein
MARRIIRKLKVFEVSGVDSPANVHARAVIFKRADVRKEQFDMSKIDNHALAMSALTAKAAELRKREPNLTEERAFARVYLHPENRALALAERKTAAATIAGAPVARTSAQVLNSLDDDEINALTVEIKRENPYLDDAGIVRLLIQSIQAPGYRSDVAAARRAGDHAPGPYEDLTPPRGTNAGAAKGELALAAITAKAAELRKADPDLTEEQAFARAYTSPANRALAVAERRANRP